ncbi:hypothetical protein K523DRAFT_241326, partial [Schizophyllum commune Tattone D]
NGPAWDPRGTSQAICFCAFLLQLRSLHSRRIQQVFEERSRHDLAREWEANFNAQRFRWALWNQQQSFFAHVATAGLETEEQLLQQTR